MLSAEFKDFIAPKARVLNLIWGALTFAPLMYVVIAWIIYGQTSSTPNEAPLLEVGSGLPLKEIGLGMILVLGFSAIFYQKRAFSGDLLAKKMAGDPVWPPEGSPMASGSGSGDKEIFERLSDSEKRLAVLWPHYQTTMIVVWAMLEAISVLGLVLTILQRDFYVVIPFAGAAVILNVMKIPRPTRFFAGVRG